MYPFLPFHSRRQKNKLLRCPQLLAHCKDDGALLARCSRICRRLHAVSWTRWLLASTVSLCIHLHFLIPVRASIFPCCRFCRTRRFGRRSAKRPLRAASRRRTVIHTYISHALHAPTHPPTHPRAPTPARARAQRSIALHPTVAVASTWARPNPARPQSGGGPAGPGPRSIPIDRRMIT